MNENKPEDNKPKKGFFFAYESTKQEAYEAMGNLFKSKGQKLEDYKIEEFNKEAFFAESAQAGELLLTRTKVLYNTSSKLLGDVIHMLSMDSLPLAEFALEDVGYRLTSIMFYRNALDEAISDHRKNSKGKRFTYQSFSKVFNSSIESDINFELEIMHSIYLEKLKGKSS